MESQIADDGQGFDGIPEDDRLSNEERSEEGNDDSSDDESDDGEGLGLRSVGATSQPPADFASLEVCPSEEIRVHMPKSKKNLV